jgi:hypothetical protein
MAEDDTYTQPQTGQQAQQQQQPGSTITPNSVILPLPPANLPSLPSVKSPDAYSPDLATSAPVVPLVTRERSAEPIQSETSFEAMSDEEIVSWTASEFVAHDKSSIWYIGLVVVAIVMAVLIWIITRDLVTSGIIVFCGVLLSVYGARKPRELHYQLSRTGIGIGERYHSYNDFHSFALIDEGAFSSVVLYPMKRFAPLLTMYFDPADEQKIVDVLSDRLPVEQPRHDPMDRLMKRIRF